MEGAEWQYWVFTVDEDISDEDLVEGLTDLGRGNYELVTVLARSDGRVTYFLKRPVGST